MFFVTYLKSLFAHTVDSVVSDIAKKVQQLETLAAQHGQNADAHAEESLQRNRLAAQESALKDKAKSIASKLNALIS